jgi:hypothetical protein
MSKKKKGKKKRKKIAHQSPDDTAIMIKGQIVPYQERAPKSLHVPHGPCSGGEHNPWEVGWSLLQPDAPSTSLDFPRLSLTTS